MRKMLHRLVTTRSAALTALAKMVIRVGLRGRPFDPIGYLRWRAVPTDADLNPYVHAALFGISESIRSLRSTFGQLSHEAPDATNRKWALVVTHDMSRTGAPILALSIVRELSNTHNVVVLALGDGELRSAFREFSSHFASDFGTRNGTKGLEKRLKSLTAQADFEIAIVNSIESAMVVKPLELLGVPTVLLVHEFVSYSSSGMQIVEGLNQASAIVFSTELTRESMVSANLVSDASKMHVFPQGKSWVPSNHVREHHDSRFRKTVRAHFGGRRTKPITVIGAGFVQYRKGVDIFIEAAKNLKGNKNQEFKFAWIGDGFSPLHDRAYSVYLEDQIERSGLAEDFVMWESSADFEWLLSQVDVFCLSSRLDPLPNVAIDAMSNGIPVVCFDKASGIADLLKQNKVLKKLVVPYLDSRELAKSIQYASEKFRRGEPSRQDLKTFCAETFEMSSYVSALRKLLISSSAR